MLLFPLLLLLLNPPQTFLDTSAQKPLKIQVAEAWRRVFDTWDGYQYLFTNVDDLKLIARHGEVVDEEIEKLSTPEQELIHHGWPNHRHVSQKIFQLYLEINTYFTIFGSFNRTIAELVMSSPSRFNEQYLEIFLKIDPIKLNMRKMRKALKFLSEKSDRIEVEVVLEAVGRLQGIKDPKVPKGLMEMTKELWRKYRGLEDETVVKEKKKEVARCENDRMLIKISIITFLASLASSAGSIYRMWSFHNVNLVKPVKRRRRWR